MKIACRTNDHWEALFVFHYISENEHHAVVEKLRRLMKQASRAGINFDVPVKGGKKGKSFEILGRFINKDESYELLSQWNEPDGDNSFMCYIPNHGIATVSDGKLDWFSLICFQCANAGIGGPNATYEGAISNRNLPVGRSLQETLIRLLPERPFPVLGL